MGESLKGLGVLRALLLRHKGRLLLLTSDCSLEKKIKRPLLREHMLVDKENLQLGGLMSHSFMFLL